MNLVVAPKAQKQLSKLPQNIKNKTHRQFFFLLSDYRHPSLHAKKMSGSEVFEARIDIHYRFTFQIEHDEIFVLTVGPHDKGLGKK